jgi:hypothetical protein
VRSLFTVNKSGGYWSGFCAALCQFCAVEFSPVLCHRQRKASNSLDTQAFLFALVGNGSQAMEKAANAAYPFDFIVESWLRG